MTVLEESKKVYNDAHAKRQKLEDKMTLKYRQIERLKNRSNKIHENFWWANVLIKPLIEVLRGEFPEIYFNDHQLTAMGMRCAVSVFGSEKEPQDGENCKTLCGITFTSGNDGQLFYDTGKYKSSEQHRASIRDYNGFDNITAPITDIQVLIDHVKRQVKENELLHLR